MKCDTDETPGLLAVPAEPDASEEGAAPLLEVRVFGGFDLSIGGEPVDSSATRQRKIQTLMTILALRHGEELYSDHLADSIWPRSSLSKKRHCFYNLWYLTTHAVYAGPRESNPYFERRQRTCRLLDAHVRTDVQKVDRACSELFRRDLDPVHAMEAYRLLQAAYRGDLLPGEMENPIIIRAREDWRERVAGALSAAAQTMMERGEDRTALWLATVASRISGLREDVARLRIELFSKMGMQAYAVRAYNELTDLLRDEAGVSPSPQSVRLMTEVVDASSLPWVVPPKTVSPRRRGVQQRVADDRPRKAELAFGGALPVQADARLRTR